MFKQFSLSILFLFLSILSFSQEKFTLSGHIKDEASGEELINATIYINEIKSGVQTNLYGYYAIVLSAGIYTVEVSYLGYNQSTKRVDLSSSNVKLNIELEEWTEEFDVVEITGKRKDANISEVEMSKVELNVDQIKSIPALMGEVDVIKAIQLLPGVQSAGEGGSGFYVRGGGKDQNLILLDEAPVYNASHMMGFFSVFNADAIKDVRLYKGGIPAEYGGRLSSLLDIRMKDGNLKHYSLKGGIGSISSRATLEGPILKNKASFLASIRRTYADVFLKLSKDEATRNTRMFFYDGNFKSNVKFNDYNRLFLSGYFGRDKLGVEDFGIHWGNATGTARFNHVWGDRLFTNISLIYSNFDYYMGAEGTTNFSWESNIEDYSMKLDNNWFVNKNNMIRLGAGTIFHRFNPGFITITGTGENNINDSLQIPKSQAFESHIYISNEQKIGSRLNLRYGVRYVWFHSFGSAEVYSFDTNYEVSDTNYYADGTIYNSYGGIEPRFGLRYTLTENSSIKVSYNRTFQYMHLMSPSSIGSMLDIWMPSSPTLAPEMADQFALGYFRNFKENIFETSLEVYYKELDNVIGFKDHAQVFGNLRVEGEVRPGTGTSYGLEVMVKKAKGKLNGWVSYTLSKADLIIPSVNNDQAFPAVYDRRHDFSIVGSWQFNKLNQIGFNWVYWTGKATTLPTDKYEYQNVNVPIYNDRNSSRLPNYHRLDLSWTKKRKPLRRDGTKRKTTIERVISVYNAYNQKNIYSLAFVTNPNDPSKINVRKTYFPIIPSITYNFDLDFDVKPKKDYENNN